jgi:hypothetical protein
MTIDNDSAFYSQPPLQSSTELVAPNSLLFKIPRLGSRRQHPVFLVLYVTIAAGTCLPRAAAQQRPPSRCLFRSPCPAAGLYATAIITSTVEIEHQHSASQVSKPAIPSTTRYANMMVEYSRRGEIWTILFSGIGLRVGWWLLAYF